VEGVLYAVDSTDASRLDESKEALHKALHDINLSNAYLCVLANKRDLIDQCVPKKSNQSYSSVPSLNLENGLFLKSAP